MPSVSVNQATAQRIARAGREFDCSMADVVEDACTDLPTDPVEIAALADRVWARMSPASRGKYIGG
jgi:hypothetical protein